MADRQSVEATIVARALKDSSYKQQLLSSPDTARAEIEKALGQNLPDGFKVQVLQETANQAYLVLPAVPSGTQLSDQQLEAIESGGIIGVPCMLGSFCLVTQ